VQPVVAEHYQAVPPALKSETGKEGAGVAEGPQLLVHLLHAIEGVVYRP
jgi:hypothetical protein